MIASFFPFSVLTQYKKIEKNLRLSCQSGFVVAHEPSMHQSMLAKRACNFAARDHKLVCNGKIVQCTSCFIKPKKGGMYCNGTYVACSLHIMVDATGQQLITEAIAHEQWPKTKKRRTASHEHNQYRQVRVVLDQIASAQAKPVCIETTGNHLMLMHANGTFKRRTKKTNVLISVRKNGDLYIDRKRYISTDVIISTVGGHLRYNGICYDGAFILCVHEGQLLLINSVPLEEYIASVLRTESWPGWPLEVNKVFAIACRSYVTSMIAQAHKMSAPYDVCNTNLHQTYAGVHDKQILKDAVKQTKGVVLMYEGKPIRAMFDSCCGGVIPADIADIYFPDAPYLARPYACTHCKNLWIYNWRAEFSPQQLHTCLFKQLGSKQKVSDLLVSKRDKAGLVQELFVGGQKKVKIDGKDLYHSCKEIKSFCYTITREKGKIVLNGRGYGHHLGLCQWGARQMVSDGWDYRRILQFYYPGTKFVRLL